MLPSYVHTLQGLHKVSGSVTKSREPVLQLSTCVPQNESMAHYHWPTELPLSSDETPFKIQGDEELPAMSMSRQ